MIFEIELNGRVRQVSVETSDRPGAYRVTLDGRPLVLDVSRAGAFGLSLVTMDGATVPESPRSSPEKVTIARSTDLQITPGKGPGELLVNLQGRTIPVRLNGRRTGHAHDTSAHGHDEVSIVAPMPGRVVRVLAAVGDDVAVRQGVVVVEAMKMENELRAPRAGRVKEISVTAGTSVEAGRILAVIE
jgi:biotin carboxyl carrier protein